MNDFSKDSSNQGLNRYELKKKIYKYLKYNKNFIIPKRFETLRKRFLKSSADILFQCYKTPYIPRVSSSGNINPENSSQNDLIIYSVLYLQQIGWITQHESGIILISNNFLPIITSLTLVETENNKI